MTPKVKQAMLTAAGLETKDINVETANNTITLKGSVPDRGSEEAGGDDREEHRGQRVQGGQSSSPSSGASGAKM